MKALTIWQPWASLIMTGAKPYENRSWNTRHRGPLAIHAAAKLPRDLQHELRRLAALGIEVPDILPRGVLLGVVDVIDVVSPEAADHPLASGPRCWKLENPRLLPEPILCQGAQSLWTVRGPALRALKLL